MGAIVSSLAKRFALLFGGEREAKVVIGKLSFLVRAAKSSYFVYSRFGSSRKDNNVI